MSSTLIPAPICIHGRRGIGAVPTWLAFMAVFSIMFAVVTSRVGAAPLGVTVPAQTTMTNRFLPYAGSGTQLIGNSPAWRDSAGVLGINNYLEGLETLTPGAAVNLNFSTWRTKRITLNQNTIFTAINIPSASTNVQTMLLEVIGDGAFTVSFANVTWQTSEITTPEAGVVTLYALRGDNGTVRGYTEAITATGIGPLTSGYIPVANATNNLTDSVMSQTGSTVTWEDTGTPYASLSLDGGFFPTLTLQAPAGFSHLVTPGALDVDTQGASAVWRFNGLALQPQAAGSVIGSTTVPLSALYAYNLIWGDGGAGANAVADSFGDGVPEGVHAAGVGSVYRNTNGAPGTVLYVKESGGAGNTGWTVVSTGGGGGGNVLNTGTPVLGNAPYYSDTTGTNVAPSGALILGVSTNASVIGSLNANRSTITNAIYASDGEYLLFHNGAVNTFLAGAGNTTLTGTNNLGIGYRSLESVTTGKRNTAIGWGAGILTTTGLQNTAVGSGAMQFNTIGTQNAAFGETALYSNVGGNNNTALGWNTLNLHTTNDHNTAVGSSSQNRNATGRYNTSVGGDSLRDQTAGDENVAIGVDALMNLETSSHNTALGTYALIVGGFNGGTIGYNTALGWGAGGSLLNGSSNIFLGMGYGVASLTNGNGNIFFGNNIGALPSNNTDNRLNIGNLIFGIGIEQATTISTGYVGIAKSDPQSTLDVGGAVTAAGRILLGNDSATATSGYLKGQSATGTDKVGGDTVIIGGVSTGTGRGGDAAVKTSLTGSTSATTNNVSTRFQAVAKYVDLTGGAATAFQKFTLATNNYAGGSITATVYASDAAFAFQSLTSTLKFDAVNVGGTNSISITSVDNTLAQIPAGGTLTCTYTAVDEGSNVFSLKANAVSSLTETILRVKWVITALNSSDAITVTPQ